MGQQPRWTPERVEELRELYFAGRSFRDIAFRMFGDRNKASAVGGKIHRMGWPLRGAQGNGANASAKKSPWAGKAGKSKPEIVAKAAPSISKPDTGPLPPLTRWKFDAVPSSAVRLVDLDHRHCRWIHGDPRGDHGYCGKPKVAGTSWCAEHIGKALPKTIVEQPAMDGAPTPANDLECVE